MNRLPTKILDQDIDVEVCGRMESNLDAVARLLAAERVDVVSLQKLDVDSLGSGQFDPIVLRPAT